MKKIVSLAIVCVIAMMAYAVPAKRGWQTRTQADGTTIEVQQVGDEFYHYTINREGKRVREINGMYEVVGEAPTPEVAKARRAEGVARRQRKDVGTTPNLAPRGIVVLVNFSDTKMKSNHTQATFDELCNSTNCTVNEGYPSAAQYFADQSNGSYRPVFDVYGPITLDNSYAYYGENVDPTDEESDDKYATDAVIEACIKLNSTVDFTQYDSDNDGYVDFVYVIYAGKGAADGGASNTIWPHNYSVQDVIKYKGQGTYSIYSKTDTKLDGVYLDNYAMSQEISGTALAGIGTLCHEFGHVIGLPDLYDTSYGNVYNNSLSPNDWNIMDGGSYNADGHCPPNYDPWEKDFFGWHTPINLGAEGQVLNLKANGTEGYQAYQINTSGKYVSPTTSGVRYYIENRQAVGWDAPLTGHGLLIWKVNFNATAWTSNAPNNSSTSGAPLYTIVSAYGTAIGWDGSTDNCPWNTFPGTKKKTSWTGVSGKPLKDIKEANQIITLTYIEEPQEEITPFDVQWFSNGVLFETNQCTKYGKVELPASNPAGCDREFIGWCANANYESATTAPTLVKAGDAVEEGAKFYAIFADVEGEGGAEETKTYTFTSKAWADATNSWTSTKDGSQLTANQGVQTTLNGTGAGAESKAAFNKVSKVVVTYCTNASKGAGSIEVAVGSTKVSHDVTKTGGTALRTLEYAFDKVSGKVAFVVNCTTNSIYVYSVDVTSGGGASYSNYSTASGCGAQGIEDLEVSKPAAVKVIREGRIVIIRGEEEFTITGERIR